ncbi:MAG TPA: carboxypeptidase regulatory-like domain-containing protein [Planctomycetota bacterium]
MKPIVWIALLLLVVAGLFLVLPQGDDPAGSGEPAANGAGTGAATLELPGGRESVGLDDASLAAAGRAELEAAAGAAGAAALRAKPASLSLQLLGPDRKPANGAGIRIGETPDAFADLPGALRRGLGGEVPDTETGRVVKADAQGRVELRDIPSGQSLDLGVTGAAWARESFSVAALLPGEHRDLGSIFLAPGTWLEGRVTDAEGRPVSLALVRLSTEAITTDVVFGMGGGVTLRTRTDADGRFRHDGLPRRSWHFAVDAAGHRSHHDTIDMETSASHFEVDVALETGGVVHGVALGAGDAAVPGSRVALVPANGFARMRWDADRVLAEGIEVAADGSFALGGIESDAPSIVMATAPGHGVARSAEVAPGQEVALRLAPLAVVTGVVRDASGRAVADANVSLEAKAEQTRGGFGPMRSPRATTDEAGHFKIERVDPGDYALVAVAPLGEVRVEPITVGIGMEPLAVTLQGGVPVVATVLDENEAPVRGAEVRMEPAQPLFQSFDLGSGSGARIRSIGDSNGGVRKARTDERGEVRFLGVKEGDWKLSTNPPGFAAVEAQLTRTPDVEQLVELRTARESMLRLQVVDGSGAPAPATRVELTRLDDEGDGWHDTRDSDRWGLIVWTGLSAGKYRASQASDEGGMVFRGGNAMIRMAQPASEATPANKPTIEFELAAAKLVEQELVLAGQALVRVLVRRHGTPIAGADVSLRERGGDGDGFNLFGGDFGGADSARTDGEGFADLPPCKPGAYELVARASQSSPPTLKDVEIRAGSQELVADLASGVLRGSVLDDGGPVSGATVALATAGPDGQTRSGRMAISMVMSANTGDEPVLQTIDLMPGQTTATTDEFGNFVFEDVPKGSWRLRIEASGYSRHTIDTFAHDGVSEVELPPTVLVRGAVLRGKVLNLPVDPDDGNGFQGMRIRMLTLLGPDDERGQTVAVRSDGSYEFRDVPPGSYRLRFSGGSTQPTSSEFSLGSGELRDFDFTLP